MNPVEKKKLENFVHEISNSMLRMDSERDLIKDICTRAKDELEIAPSTLKKISKIYYKNTLVEEKLANEELFDLYEQVFNVTEAGA